MKTLCKQSVYGNRRTHERTSTNHVARNGKMNARPVTLAFTASSAKVLRRKIECDTKHHELCGVCYKQDLIPKRTKSNCATLKKPGGVRACRKNVLKKNHGKKRCVPKTLLFSAFPIFATEKIAH